MQSAQSTSKSAPSAPSPAAPTTEPSRAPQKKELRAMSYDEGAQATSFDAGARARAPSPAVPMKAGGGKTLTTAEVDVTFEQWLGVYRNVDRALAKTREQIGAGMPKGYVPPPLRAETHKSQQTVATKASPFGAAPGSGECIDPNGQSVAVDPEQQRIDEFHQGATTPDPNIGGHASEETHTAGATGAGKGAPAKDKYELEKGWTRGPLGFGIKSAPDGASAELAWKKELWNKPIPTSVPGVVVKPTIGVQASGSASVKSDGSFEGTLSGKLDGYVGIGFGVPGATVSAGPKIAVELTGVGVKRDAAGKWTCTPPGAALKAAFALVFEFGAPVEEAPAGAPGWRGAGLKWEYNPGGEFELATLTFPGPQLLPGADIARLVEGAKNAVKALQTAGASVTDREVEKEKQRLRTGPTTMIRGNKM